jgi:hypothetical protein
MQVDELAIARRGKPRWAYSGDVEWTAKAVWWVRAVAVGVLVILLAGRECRRRAMPAGSQSSTFLRSKKDTSPGVCQQLMQVRCLSDRRYDPKTRQEFTCDYSVLV